MVLGRLGTSWAALGLTWARLVGVLGVSSGCLGGVLALGAALDRFGMVLVLSRHRFFKPFVLNFNIFKCAFRPPFQARFNTAAREPKGLRWGKMALRSFETCLGSG